MKEVQYIQAKNEVGREAREINEASVIACLGKALHFSETAEQLLSFFKAVEIYNQNFPLESTLTAVWRTDWGQGGGERLEPQSLYSFYGVDNYG